MVFRKQVNKKGNYQDANGVCYEILHCERTESKEWYDTGEVNQEGNPIFASRIVINKGWDVFPSEEAAAEAYGLVPMESEI